MSIQGQDQSPHLLNLKRSRTTAHTLHGMDNEMTLDEMTWMS